MDIEAIICPNPRKWPTFWRRALLLTCPVSVLALAIWTVLSTILFVVAFLVVGLVLGSASAAFDASQQVRRWARDLWSASNGEA